MTILLLCIGFRVSAQEAVPVTDSIRAYRISYMKNYHRQNANNKNKLNTKRQSNSSFVRIYSINNSVRSGYLYEVNDSAFTIYSSRSEPSVINTIRYTEMNKIRFGPKNRFGNSVLIPAAIGAFIGVIAGFAAGDDECKGLLDCIYTLTAEEKALIYGGLLGIGGGVIGAFIMSFSVKIPIKIHGNYANYNNNKQRFKGYAIKR